MANDIDWPSIRLRHLRGEALYSISKSLDWRPTRQGIAARAKKEGWTKTTNGQIQVYDDNQQLTDARNIQKDIILQAVLAGATYKLAAAKAGVSEKTIERWRKKDPDFATLVVKARAQRLVKHEENINDAGDRGDWKASAYMLERDPLTKDQYAKQEESPKTAIQFNIGINRDEVKIR